MATHSVYDEVANFMATMNPAKVVAFKPSLDNQERFNILLTKNENANLAANEKSELELYLMLNRIIGLAKAQALNILSKCVIN